MSRASCAGDAAANGKEYSARDDDDDDDDDAIDGEDEGENDYDNDFYGAGDGDLENAKKACSIDSKRRQPCGGPLGGSWDLVTTYCWDYNPTYNWGNPCKAI